MQKINFQYYESFDLDTCSNNDVKDFLIEFFNNSDFIAAQTSGSTGVPKTIKLKKSLLIESAKRTNEFFRLQKTGSNLLLCISPKYIGGKMMIVRAIENGSTLTFPDKFSSSLPLTNEVIDLLALTPHLLEQNFHRINFNILKNLIIGGAPITDKIENKLLSTSTKCYETYGMTETASHIALRKIGEPYFKALSGIKLSTNSNCQLIIKLNGYNETAIVTNDIVELASNNHFKWLGRIDNVINTGGIKVHPEQIEFKLSKLIDVNFLVFGESNELYGEQVCILLECNSTHISKLPLEKWFKLHLDKYEIPKTIYLLNQFCYTKNKKINRKETVAKRLRVGI